MVERPGEPRIRNDGERVGIGVYVGGEQPREPADAVRQRSDHAIPPARRSSSATTTRGAVLGRHAGAAAATADAGRWVVRHAAGVTRYQHAIAGLEQELAVFVPPDDPVKLAMPDADEHVDGHDASERLRVRRMVSGPPRVGERRFVVTELDDSDRRDLRAQPLQHRVQRTGRLLARHRARRLAYVRSRRVRWAQPLAEPAGWPLARAAGRPQRRGPRSVRRAADRRSTRTGRISTHRVRAGSGARRRARGGARRPLHVARARRSRAHETRALLGRHAGRHPGAHAGRLVRPDRQSLAALSVAELPHLGAQRAVPARRRVRLPRPAAGRARADLHASGSLPCAPAPRRVATVRRGRRSALVASAERARHANALLGRSALAALCGRGVRRPDRRRVRARRGRAVPRSAAARAGPVGGLRPAVGLERSGVAVRALRPRDRSLDEVRRARPAASSAPATGTTA